MKIKILVIALLAICLIATGCSGSMPKEEMLNGFSMSIKEGTLTKTGATIIIIDSNKEEEHTYGEFYRIDKKENNKWVSLKTIIDNYGFNDIGYYVDENNELEMEINWQWLYGELEPGEYRLVKDVAIGRGDSYVGNKYLYTEFKIE